MKFYKSFLFTLTLLVAQGCTTVGPGERGVRITLGKADEETLDSGVYIWVPFVSRVRTLSVQTRKADILSSDAASRDTQQTKVHTVVNYQIDPKHVVQIVREFGDENEAIAAVNKAKGEAESQAGLFGILFVFLSIALVGFQERLNKFFIEK